MPNRRGKTITIRETDNTTTVKGRVTFPKGTRIPQEDLASSPSTAPAGALSGGQGNLPGRPPINPNNPASGAWANFNASQSSAGYNPTTGVLPSRTNQPSYGGSYNPNVNPTAQINLQHPNAAYSSAVNLGYSPTTYLYPNMTSSQYEEAMANASRGAGVNRTSLGGRGTMLPTDRFGTDRFGSFTGTAGMYTYGRFSDPGEAFAALLDRGVPTNVPSYIADRFGMTAALQQPNSGWALQGNDWVQTPTSGAGGGTAGTTSGTGGTSPYAPNSGYTVQPTIPITNFQNTGGANNTDFTQTAYYQWAVANGIPFEQQTRWDARTGRYISIEKYLKNEKDRKMKRGHWGGTNDTTNYGGGGSYYDYANPYNTDMHSTPSPFTGSWGVVNFNTGGG